MAGQGEAPRPQRSIEIIPTSAMKELGEYFSPSNELLDEGEKMFRQYLGYIKKAEAGVVHFNAATERIAKNKLHNVSAAQLHDYAMSYTPWINSWHGREKLKHDDWTRGHKDRIIETLRAIDPSLSEVNSTH